MPKLTDSNVHHWPAVTLPHAHALVDSLAALRARTLREQGYQYLAQIGQDHSLRLKHYPDSIDMNGLCLSRLAAGFRAILYSDDQYIYKAGHNLSFEIQREWRQYCETLSRLAAAQSRFL